MDPLMEVSRSYRENPTGISALLKKYLDFKIIMAKAIHESRSGRQVRSRIRNRIIEMVSVSS
jgi:hypothetical protein